MSTKSIVILGAGRFGRAIARELFEEDVEVMLVDKNYDIIQKMANHVTSAIQCDLINEEDVHSLGLSNFDVAIVGIGSNLEASIIATLVAKEYNIPMIIAKASNELQAKILKKIGADSIVQPEVDMGVRLAHTLINQEQV